MDMKPPKNKIEARLSQAEAERAIYIDFEGFEDHSPSLLGILIDNTLEQVVLDARLSLAAEAKNLRVATLHDSVRDLLAQSKAEGRLIVAYSQHEKNVIEKFAQTDLTGPYRDARMIAKRWRTICHTGRPIGGRGLKDFLEFINFPRGTYLGEKKSTSRLKSVGDMLARKENYQALTPVAKAKWTKLLEHNEIDCRGMCALVVLAAKELGVAQR